jgi:hypothetical protein
MKGWKTWAGAALIGAGAVLSFLGQPVLGELLTRLGEGLALIGVAHKIEKAGILRTARV